MSCLYPLKAWRGPIGKTGGAIAVFDPKLSKMPDRPFLLPCQRCTGCRLDRSFAWAVRCVHESKLYDENCFITLTYDNEHLPLHGSLNIVDFQKFMKRLRVNIKRRGDQRRLRLFYCGEYGEKGGRPHYHAVIFNYDFADKKFQKETSAGEKVYSSAFLSDCWQSGDCTVGAVSVQSAGYVARYCTKKIVGGEAEDFYSVVDEFGEVHRLVPPFSHSSNQNGGIGFGWFQKYYEDWFKQDGCIVDGVKVRIPRAYDKYFAAKFPREMARIKRERRKRAEAFAEHQTPDRRAVRDVVLQARIRDLRRDL